MIVQSCPIRSWIPARRARKFHPHGQDARSVAPRSPKLLGVLVWGERNSHPGRDLLGCCHSDL